MRAADNLPGNDPMSAPSLREFWAACGGEGPLRLQVEQRSRAAVERLVPTPFAVIGRGEHCDLVLPREDVSRQHALLQLVAGQLWCIDISTRAGKERSTLQNYARVLHPRRSFRIGVSRIGLPAALGPP